MIIGIAGASRSGKSTLAQNLKELLPSGSVTVINQDDFTFPKNQIPKIDEHIDWEHPDGIDFFKLKQAILQSSNDYTIVEGFLLFYSSEVFKLLDKSVFIQIDEASFKERKRKDTRWGGPVSDAYIDHIWDSYLKFGKVNAKDADFEINSDQIKESALQIVTSLKRATV